MDVQEKAILLAKELKIAEDLREAILGAVTMLGGDNISAQAEAMLDEIGDQMLQDVASGYVECLKEDTITQVLEFMQSEPSQQWAVAQPALQAHFKGIIQRYTQELGPRMAELIMDGLKASQAYQKDLESLKPEDDGDENLDVDKLVFGDDHKPQ